MSEFLPLLFVDEVAVFLPWQKEAHELAVWIEERPEGWFGGFGYIAPSPRVRPGGLFDVFRGPYVSREAAIRNCVAFGVHHLFGQGLSIETAARLYRAAGVPIPPRWPRSAALTDGPLDPPLDDKDEEAAA